MTDIDILAPDTLRIERLLEAPRATVWRYLVEGELRRRWFAGGGDASADGEVELVFDHDELSADDVPCPPAYADHQGARWHERVLEFDPPHLLAISWDGGANGIVRFELFEESDRTRLVLTHSGISGSGPMANFGGGWLSHVAVLEGLLNGRPVRDFRARHALSEAAVAARMASTN